MDKLQALKSSDGERHLVIILIKVKVLYIACLVKSQYMLRLYNVPRNNKETFCKEEDRVNDLEEDKRNELMVTNL